MSYWKLKGIALSVFLTAASLVAAAPGVVDLELNSGENCTSVKVVSKNQFGVSIFDHDDKQTGKVITRYIPFSDMTSNTLLLFPYCDSKTISRLAAALTDRCELIRKRFKDEIEKCSKETDFAASTNAPTGITYLRVFVQVTETCENGFIGIAFSDAQEASFYGYVYIYGVKAAKGALWTDTVYPNPQGDTIKLKGKTYPSYTIYAPARPSILDEEESDEKKKMGPPPDGKKPMGPPPGGKGGKGGNRMPPPPKGGGAAPAPGAPAGKK